MKTYAGLISTSALRLAIQITHLPSDGMGETVHKQSKTREELQRKVHAALTQERCCEGIRDFDLYRHAHDELGVNWSIKLRDGDPEGKCYEGINAVVAMLAKAYDLAE